MGYLTIDIKQREDVKTFRFFYGTYDDGVWKAKLIDSDTAYEMGFSYNTIEECYAELSNLLKNFGHIHEIKAHTSEEPFIAGFALLEEAH
jgi:hypothetical protein